MLALSRARRAAKEAKEAPPQPAPEKPRVDIKKFVKIGRPGYKGNKIKFLNFRTPTHSKIQAESFYHGVIPPKYANGLANSEDPDQTCLSENLGSLQYYFTL